MNNDNQNILLSFIIGAAAGVTAGLLLAPETGEETRRTITRKATNLKDQVGSQINSTVGKVNETIGKLKKGESKPDTPTATNQGAKKNKKTGTGTGVGSSTGTGPGNTPTI
jgi:gas vesicle protein